jgi:hypothetical protein
MKMVVETMIYIHSSSKLRSSSAIGMDKDGFPVVALACGTSMNDGHGGNSSHLA